MAQKEKICRDTNRSCPRGVEEKVESKTFSRRRMETVPVYIYFLTWNPMSIIFSTSALSTSTSLRCMGAYTPGFEVCDRGFLI